ncbi:capsular exopolysaccharide synthesis family protein [Paenibacillus phyllosphaerae]|uniref:non-specific protein-tyrosine kinase n=1 Tax=Paenibacillus phyllosphaerae TaxID=274593 RepID=A0A7W5AYQ0_9BACL|nr:CpsD/CapB family tyrosine-protein kinase [Paenibacillus phyllosphaerae]MBB3110571.1 capsular exopolysaccharide synthesis family protein [Paenibacillus phyllosphaerae]
MSKLENKRPLISLLNPKSPVAEAYRSVRTNIDFSSLDTSMQVVMVTSATPGEGKSTTIGNLAVVYAQADKRVLLIDADMRKPTVHHTFRLSNRVGLSSVISRQAEVKAAIQETDIPNLFTLPSGPIPPNPSEMLGSNRMTTLIDELRGQFDLILIDTPPVLAVTDAQIMATKSDGVLLVLEAGRVKRDMALKAKQQMMQVKANIIGVVLNNVKKKNSEGYYYYQYESSES